jgi:hypothetical protein
VRRPNVNVVALILAVSLSIVLIAVVVGAILQIFISTKHPVLNLSTSVLLDSGTTGIVGILGSYIGYSMKLRQDEHDQENDPSFGRFEVEKVVKDEPTVPNDTTLYVGSEEFKNQQSSK